MRAGRVLQKFLSESLGDMHALREAVLLRSVEALIAAGPEPLPDRIEHYASDSFTLAPFWCQSLAWCAR